MKHNFEKSNMLYSIEELKGIAQNMKSELEKAQRHEATSLAFLENSLPKDSLAKKGEVFQVMAIGGSNFETALIKKNGAHVEPNSYFKSDLIILRNKDILLGLILKHLDKDVNLLCLNFAFFVNNIGCRNYKCLINLVDRIPFCFNRV